MPVLKHKEPCPECPFKRTSLAGWLGSATPEAFIQSTITEEHMPCHSDIDYEKKDWREKQYPTAAHCAGSLIFLRNTCKLPRNKELAKRVGAVAPDRVAVFSFTGEFVKHHRRGK